MCAGVFALMSVAPWSPSAAAYCAATSGSGALDYVIGDGDTANSINLSRDCPNLSTDAPVVLVQSDVALGDHTALATGRGAIAWAINNNGQIDGSVTGLYNTSTRDVSINNQLILQDDGSVIAGAISGGSFGINSEGKLTLHNHSEVSSDTYIAVKTLQGGSITNYAGGSIIGGLAPDHTGHTGGGVVNYAELELDNLGKIYGKSVGVTNFSGGDAKIANSATGTIDGRYGVSSSGHMMLDNSGNITGSFVGVKNEVLPTTPEGASGTINNKQGALIQGQFAIVNSGLLTLNNEGRVDGDTAVQNGRFDGGGVSTLTLDNYGEVLGGRFSGSGGDGLSNTGIVNTSRLTLNNYNAIEGNGLATATGVKTASTLSTQITNHAGATISGNVEGDSADGNRPTEMGIGISNAGVLTLSNEGKVIGSGVNGGAGIRNAGDLGTDIDNKQGGAIAGDSFGIDNTGAIDVVNHGEIKGVVAGINHEGAELDLDNRGVIKSEGFGITEGVGIAVASSSDKTRIDNLLHGSIAGTRIGVENKENSVLTLTNLDSNISGDAPVASTGVDNAGALTLTNTVTLKNETNTQDPTGEINPGIFGSAFGVKNTGSLTLTNLDGKIFGDSPLLSSGSTGVDNAGALTLYNKTNPQDPDPQDPAGEINQGIYGSAFGVNNTGSLDLSNHGFIGGGSVKRDDSDDETGFGFGVQTESDKKVKLVNDKNGHIWGAKTGVVVKNTGGTVELYNLGSVDGDVDYGVEADSSGSNHTDTAFYNLAGGTISGRKAGVMNGGLLTLHNQSGEISGDEAGVLNKGELLLHNEEGSSLGRDPSLISGNYGVESEGYLWLRNSGRILGAVTGVKSSASELDTLIDNEEHGVIEGAGIEKFGIEHDGAHITVENRGLIKGDSAIHIRKSSEESKIINFDDGTIRGAFAGIWANDAANAAVDNKAGAMIRGGRRGVYNSGDLTIENAGFIKGGINDGITPKDEAIYGARYSSTTVTNLEGGLIEGGRQGINNFGALTLDNHGRIEGPWYGVFTASNELSRITNHMTGEIGVANTDGSAIFNQGDLQINNFGDIGTGGISHAIENNSELTLNNAGRIGSAESEIGIENNYELTVTNDNVIRGSAYGIRANEKFDDVISQTTINNLSRGTITGGSGAILVTTGALSLVNAGTIEGDVTAGVFDDVVELHSSSTINGSVSVGGGRDTLRLGGPDNNMNGVWLINSYSGFDVIEKTTDVTWEIGGLKEPDDKADFYVNDGMLINRASVPGWNFTVAKGGKLIGSELTVIGGLTAKNGAVIAPGDAVSNNTNDLIGELLVEGDVVFKAGSTYEVDVGNEPDPEGLLFEVLSDRIIAKESKVSIEAQTTLAISVLDPANITSMRLFTIITADHISGDFSRVTDNLPDIDVVISKSIEKDIGQDNESIIGEIQPASNQPATSAAATATPVYSSKEVHPSALMASLDNAQQFTDTLMGRGAATTGFAAGAAGFATGRTERPSGAWWAPLGARAQLSGDIFAGRNNAAFGDVIFSLENNIDGGARPVSAGLAGAFSRTDIGDDGVAPGWTAAMGGVVFGADYNFHEAGAPVSIGFASGFSRTNVDVGASQADLEAWHMGLYGGLEAQALSLSGAVAYAHYTYDFSREVVFGGGREMAGSDADGDNFMISGEAFYDLAPRFGGRGLRFGPVATVDAVYATRDSFTESGVGILNLTVEGDSVAQAATGLGGAVRFSPRTRAGMRVALEGRLLWEHIHGDVNARTTSSIPLAEATFVTSSARLAARDRAVVGLGAGVNITNALNFEARYDGAFSADAPDHRLTAGFIWRY